MSPNKFIYFLTGASGVGKTTLVSLLQQKYGMHKGWQFLHFDTIGVPSAQEMKEQYGSGEKWQEAMTHKWIETIVQGKDNSQIVILEGQVNLEFIRDAFIQHNYTSYQIMHIDCDEQEMCDRLIHQRNQPELATEDMKNWLRFLRQQAKKLKVVSLNTTDISPHEILKRFESFTNLSSLEA